MAAFFFAAMIAAIVLAGWCWLKMDEAEFRIAEWDRMQRERGERRRMDALEGKDG